MFRYDKKQTVFEIGGFRVGGQPGEYPTVLASSMFYDRHKVVIDHVHGEFDKAAAEAQWNTQVELSDQTSVGYWNQVIAETEVAMQKVHRLAPGNRPRHRLPRRFERAGGAHVRGKILG